MSSPFQPKPHCCSSSCLCGQCALHWFAIRCDCCYMQVCFHNANIAQEGKPQATLPSEHDKHSATHPKIRSHVVVHWSARDAVMCLLHIAPASSSSSCATQYQMCMSYNAHHMLRLQQRASVAMLSVCMPPGWFRHRWTNCSAAFSVRVCSRRPLVHCAVGPCYCGFVHLSHW